MTPPDPLPPELFLDGYPPGIRDIAERLRALVDEAVPEAISGIRSRP